MNVATQPTTRLLFDTTFSLVPISPRIREKTATAIIAMYEKSKARTHRFPKVKRLGVIHRKGEDGPSGELLTSESWMLLRIPLLSSRSIAFPLALGGLLPAIAIQRLGMAWTAPPFLLFYLLASSFSVAIGFAVRSLATTRKMSYAVVLGLISANAMFFIVFKAIPEWMDRQAY
jgi:hypothetical protein